MKTIAGDAAVIIHYVLNNLYLGMFVPRHPDEVYFYSFDGVLYTTINPKEL